VLIEDESSDVLVFKCGSKFDQVVELSNNQLVPNRSGHHREKVGQLYVQILAIIVQGKGNSRQFSIQFWRIITAITTF